MLTILIIIAVLIWLGNRAAARRGGKISSGELRENIEWGERKLAKEKIEIAEMTDSLDRFNAMSAEGKAEYWRERHEAEALLRAEQAHRPIPKTSLPARMLADDLRRGYKEYP
jgi:hypothetical protein